MSIAAITIAILSFLISGISLYFSLRKNRLEKRIASAQRKTEILRHITNSKIKCERRLSKIRAMNKVWETCQTCPTEDLKEIEKGVIVSIQKYNNAFNTTRSIDVNTDPILIENLIPDYYDLSQEADESFLKTIDLIEGCVTCQEKIKKTTQHK